jgi:hypothetical protein
VAKRPESVLKVVALWGNEVVAHRELRPGESLGIGDRPGSLAPKPDGVTAPDYPVRTVRGGWEVDPQGAAGGLLCVGGASSDLAARASDAPRPLLGSGDYGLLQYGQFALFFQLVRPGPPLARRRSADWTWRSSLVLALVVVGGAVALMRLLSSPEARPKPVELASRGELAALFRVRPDMFEARRGGQATPPRPDDESGENLEDRGSSLKAAMASMASNTPPTSSGSLASIPSVRRSGDGLSPAEISRVVMARYDDFRACHALYAGARPAREGGVTVSFTVTQRGRPDGATIGSSTLGDQRVEDCVLRRFNALEFPASDHPTHASFTFSFKGGGK